MRNTQRSPTSYSCPFRINYDGEIHIVPRLNERVHGVDVDFVSREYLLGVDASHQDRCVVRLRKLSKLRECSHARLEDKETTVNHSLLRVALGIFVGGGIESSYPAPPKKN